MLHYLDLMVLQTKQKLFFFSGDSVLCSFDESADCRRSKEIFGVNPFQEFIVAFILIVQNPIPIQPIYAFCNKS